MPHFDCQACGVCCLNTEKNLELKTRDYVEVEREDRLYTERRDLLKQVAVRNEEGVWFMRLVGDDQRCCCLEGELEVGVGCGIYDVRPRVCRVVDSGDEECLKARKRFGLPCTWAEEKVRIAKLDDLD
jgi:Fe-S-cluster containining protein